jgi:2-hydroxychromene-2-carboxylate isomerase
VFETAQFVFSLRSPYAWIAARWVLPQLPPGLEPTWRPFYPLASFPNFPPLLPAKVRYLARDVMRLVEHYGGEPLRFPELDDPDWSVPHCAFLAAQERGRGREFALAVWQARFGRGEDVGREPVLARAAGVAGLEAEPVLRAARDPERRAALTAQVRQDFDERGIFGVPTLILPRGTRYWGHDRIEWAIREGRLPA